MRTLRTVDAGAVAGVALEIGEVAAVGVALALGDGVGDSCAAATNAHKNTPPIVNCLNIISPVHVWKKIIARLTVGQKRKIDIFIRHELIVQSIETIKMI